MALLCLWQLPRLHCRYQAKLCFLYSTTNLAEKKQTQLKAISDMLIWNAVINRTVNISAFAVTVRHCSVAADVCSHSPFPPPSSLHRWNTQTVEICQTTEEKMVITIQSTNGCSNVCGSCCKWPCVTAVGDKGLFICNLQLSICCTLLRTRIEKRRKVRDPEHRNGNVPQ